MPDKPDNVEFRHCTKAEFASLVTQKMGFEVNFENPMKICDFKPVFGYIFEEDLKDYQYWGYSDIDIVFGNMDQWLRPMMGRYDVISGYRGFLSGPFCLFRNNDDMINMFKLQPDYRSILQDPLHLAFDESISHQKVRGFFCHAGEKLLYLLRTNPFPWRPREIRYQYQWHLKKKMDRPPSDMTDIIFQKQNKGEISAAFTDLIQSDRSWKRQGRKKWHIRFNDGILEEAGNSWKIFAFHFVDSKSREDFHISELTNIQASFILTEKGMQA